MHKMRAKGSIKMLASVWSIHLLEKNNGIGNGEREREKKYKNIDHQDHELGSHGILPGGRGSRSHLTCRLTKGALAGPFSAAPSEWRSEKRFVCECLRLGPSSEILVFWLIQSK